uniref:CSON005031 protein n=1 Tax=Culicoides sonorensis TaxID=179676 RepID=A0A336MPY6_CULSO
MRLFAYMIVIIYFLSIVCYSSGSIIKSGLNCQKGYVAIRLKKKSKQKYSKEMSNLFPNQINFHKLNKYKYAFKLLII